MSPEALPNESRCVLGFNPLRQWWWWCSVTKLCLTLCDPMDCSLPGSSVHGISQERILEWAAISVSRGSS